MFILIEISGGWSILYIEGSQVIISKKILHSFILRSSFADTDEMTPAAFHLGLFCLQMVSFFLYIASRPREQKIL